MSAGPQKATIGAPGRRRRRYPRHRASFPVVVTLLAGGVYQNLNAHCKDLSEAGIGVLVAAELTCGEVASLKFRLGESQSSKPENWEVRAVLRHRRGYHYGFEFLSLGGERTSFLKEYLQDLERAD
jgi:PilZ domain